MIKTITILACLYVTLLSNVACSERENLTEPIEITANKTIDVKQLKKAMSIIQNELNTNQSLVNKIRENAENVSYSKGADQPIPQYLDQETLDYFMSLINFQGNVDLNEINQIIHENILANQVGHENFIDSTNFSNNTKIILRDLISENPSIIDLSSDPRFQSLSNSEKSMLLDIEVVTNPQNRVSEAGCAAVGGVIGTVINPGVGTFIGILVGGLLCHGK